MTLSHLSLLCLLLYSCAACQSDSADRQVVPTPRLQEISTPVAEGGQPNLFLAGDGTLYLSWVDYLDDTTDALRLAPWEGQGWGAAREIARGTDWFVNWADFPSFATFPGSEAAAAHWLQKSAMGTYDYDVRIALSPDAGRQWSPAFIPHTDGVAAEHGFVTLLPLPNGRIMATWLDGRNTKTTEETQDHGHGGAMTLRAAEFDTTGQLFAEAELDARVCDCCQTDAAWTTDGPVVVYRNRSDEEIRDMAIVRRVNGEWTAPALIHADNWVIPGCPVNGPAVAANGPPVAVACFTAAHDSARVLVAFSPDAGATFQPPIRLDQGNPEGRVDVVRTANGTAWVSWLERADQVAEIRLAEIRPDGHVQGNYALTTTEASRQSGFPILERLDDRLLLAWTAVDSTGTSVKTATIDW
ncbi:MAG: hypothetical protein KDC54_09665 [Lewinella sp.]|nr:hypothetical protein [Lewinella sp.]